MKSGRQKKITKNQDPSNSKSIWRLLLPQTQRSIDSLQQEKTPSCKTNIQTQNAFFDLEMQEHQEKYQTREYDSWKTTTQYVQQKNENAKTSTVKKNLNTNKEQKQQSSIIRAQILTQFSKVPITPKIIVVDAGCTVEVIGGMDGGVKRKPLT